MIEWFVPSTSPHKHLVRGDVDMKEYQFGDAKVVIHSDLVNLTSTERKQWFESEKQKGNPILKEISEAIHACYED